ATVVAVEAVDVVVQGLIKALTAHIGAKLVGMTSLHPAQTIGPLEGVSYLRKLALEIIAVGEQARNVHKGHTFAPRAKPGMDAGVVGGSTVTKAGIRRDRGAGVLHQVGTRRVEEVPLGFPEVCEMGLVHQSVAEGPVVSEVPLLVAVFGIGAKAQHGSSTRLKA